MHRSNLIHLLLAVLFVLLLGVVWLWSENVHERLRMWASWITVTYGCVAGYWIWLHGLRLSRLVDDIPTSRIATAAQGYVELLGRAAQFEDQRAKALIGSTVLWYRKEVAERSGAGGGHAIPFNVFYVPVDVEESATPFAIDDGTGTACILPHGAQILCGRKQIRHEDNRRVTEEEMVPGDSLYVVGDFSTYTLQPQFDQAAYELTRRWESDPARRALFDANRDGRLDQKEWLEMHAAAGARVMQDALPAGSPEPRHLIFRPDDGRPFLISSVAPAALAGHYRYWMVLGLLLFLGCGAVSAALILGRMLF
jgi:hypothetical protein